MEETKTKISPYIAGIKDRKIKQIINRYLEAYGSFKEYNKSFHEGIIMSFSNLRKVHDILWEIKENFHLVYKRVLNPRKKIFEQANKFTPSDSEINFMNNVGLLFHKVMVARELKYVLDYYEEDSNSYQETRASLERNLDRIDSLFDQGIKLLVQMLENYQNNIQLITYFLENKETCESLIQKGNIELLKILSRGRDIEDIYMDAVHYYQNSGWTDKAEVVLRELLRINPSHEKAAVMLQAINI
jgi:predicted DNA-binding protein YlxM (UPF0122 family)